MSSEGDAAAAAVRPLVRLATRSLRKSCFSARSTAHSVSQGQVCKRRARGTLSGEMQGVPALLAEVKGAHSVAAGARAGAHSTSGRDSMGCGKREEGPYET